MVNKRRILRILNNLDDFLLIVAVIWMGGVLTLQIIMRYIFNSPLIWSEEMARYTFVWICFLGVGYGIKYDHHIKMEVFFSLLPLGAQRVINLATNALIIVFLLLIIPGGIDFVRQVDNVASTAMEIPTSWVYVSVPLGLSIAVIRLLVLCLNLLGLVKKETAS